jgi:nicotinate-nucleotide adenylyltransferase
LKLGILGGSFDPVHRGHLFLAEKVLSALKLDRIIFIPAYRSPFKLDAEGMDKSVKDRIDMLASSIMGDSRFAIDYCEIKREGVSYTINTLEDIIERYAPTGKPVLVIGDDLAEDFPKWRDSGKILKMADIAVARRINSKPVKYPFAHTAIENEIIDISSHEIRRIISEGGDWQSLIPSGAANIVKNRKLYGYNGEPSAEAPSDDIARRIETEAMETLSTERYLHSRSTALAAVDLCRRFGLNPADGYLAGVAHDLAKEMDNKQMMKIVKTAGFDISPLEDGKPNLLHGKAAAVLLRERFSIHNEDIIEAVAYHTSGQENMHALAKVIYIADKTEFSRVIDPAIRKMCMEDTLDNILFAVLEKNIQKLQAKGADLSKETILLINKIKEKKN